MKWFICFLGLVSTIMANNELLKNSSDQFTAKMFQEVVKLNPGKSVILSAFSVMPPLAQLSLASEGPSHDELLTAISIPSNDNINEVFSSVNQQLRAVKGVTLQMASRIYVAKDAKINQTFAALSRDLFNSDVKNVDFTKNVESATDINTWVEEQTNHKIKHLVNPDDLTAETRSVLVNALYFKGTWEHKFEVKNTKDKEFHVSKTKSVQVPTMFITETFRYGESAELNAKLLEIPYKDKEASFLVVLPNEVDGLASLVEKLKDASALNRAVGDMSQNKVEVSLPKFKIETETDLEKVLKQINVKKIFNAGEAQLNNLLEGESGLYISKAIQKAFIEVNEEGAEAAAANAFVVSYRSAKLFEPRVKLFVADHSFYYQLRYKSNGNENTLFSGVYSA